MNSDSFSASSPEGEDVLYHPLPAGKLLSMELPPEQREKIINCLVNEAIAARELLKITPDGDGRIILSPKDNVTKEIATTYGWRVLDTNDAFMGTGYSYEMLRD